MAKYAREWIIRVQDISRFVRAQRAHALAGGEEDVMIPKQRVYPVHDSSVAARLGLEQAQP
ncbi:hypothetical protein HYU19_00540 [Candidatus Woesearchaeota archaeon]|nr:hypothetical protein [Candidatus Woesearchaeota archaeon]